MYEILVLSDENGVEMEFEVLDTIDYEGERYVVLIRDEDDEVTILKVESESDDDMDVVEIDDQNTAEEVYHIFKERNADNLDFED
ncbi:MAG TPA: DUF1292 domain-containing protein [Lachnospiraceae bacterium]|nr:DUF1292 domain-containing protein [Lachnospiraceae bacterium]